MIDALVPGTQHGLKAAPPVLLPNHSHDLGILLAAVCALALKLFLAFHTVGTNDALTWEHDLAKLRTEGYAALYRDGVVYPAPTGQLYPRQDFVHPPPVLHVLRLFGALADATGWPLRFWLRSACALADAGMLALMWLMLGKRVRRAPLILLALSPLSILISGFHANTDPIMIFFVVASVFFAERRRVGWSAVMLGLATGIKLVPVIFAPAILFYLAGGRSRTKWAATYAAVWLAAGMPYLAQEPRLILNTMLSYNSAMGWWGFYFLSGLLKGTPLEFLYHAYAPAAKWIALLMAGLVPLSIRLRGLRISLFAECGTVLFAFLFFSPEFALQYLAWTVPWVLALGAGPMAAYYSVTGACLLAVYAAAANGIRWGAYADTVTTSTTVRLLSRLVCWLAVGAILLSFCWWDWSAGSPEETVEKAK